MTNNDMSAKRALIVDDSRSARVILSRMLEGYGLQIDAVESAEEALEYLKHGKPDVIFMDHLMPGMDGFQAIQAIKSNPLTATIPVMMYTSQEGELYLSQARALGAVGVLPKTVKQAELSRVLYQLRLLPERRDPRVVVHVGEDRHAASHGRPRRTEAPADEASTVQIDAPPKLTLGEVETALRNAIGPALQEQNLELRRLVASSLESLLRRIQANAGTQGSAPGTAGAAVNEPSAAAPERSRLRWPLVAAIAACALLPTIALAVLYAGTLRSTAQILESNAQLAALIEEQQAQLAALHGEAQDENADAHDESAASTRIEYEPVPYGEPPLAGKRLDRLRAMVDELRQQGFRGRLRIATYVGEFCLTGNGIEGYSIAADDLPMKRCDLVGNPFDDSLTAAQRQSLAFANLVSTIKQQVGDALAIEVAYAGRIPSVPYPDRERLENATAGEWNRIAQQNNRVEFAAVPLGSS